MWGRWLCNCLHIAQGSSCLHVCWTHSKFTIYPLSLETDKTQVSPVQALDSLSFVCFQKSCQIHFYGEIAVSYHLAIRLCHYALSYKYYSDLIFPPNCIFLSLKIWTVCFLSDLLRGRLLVDMMTTKQQTPPPPSLKKLLPWYSSVWLPLKQSKYKQR